MYKFYKNNDEMTGERSQQYFEANEAYYIDSNSLKVLNENYTEEDAQEYNHKKEIHNILYGGDNTQMYRLYDPADIAYDYSYARSNASDGYGTIEEQLEYIAENGVTAFKSKQAAVKTRYPKPE